jgi:hypothetical protein
MWRPFFPKAASISLLDVRADRIKAAHLLFDEFSSAVILSRDLRGSPKVIKQLTGELVNAERLQTII